jgi:2'-5' RNA ligase
MAKDHFETHAYMHGKTDWNFNILFDDQPQVAEMVSRYASLLKRDDLYPPIPTQWLHMTILRVGFTTEFTAAEMQQVATQLSPALAEMRLPAFTIGPAWMYKGYPLLHLAPAEPLEEIFQHVLSALRQVVGVQRLPLPVDRPATKLIPHVSLAYTRDDTNEQELEELLTAHPIPPVEFRLNHLALIKQEPVSGHYEWKTVQKLPIGQQQ